MNRKGIFGRLALFATALIWGTSFVILKGALDTVGAMWVLAVRFVLSTLLLCLIAGKRLLKMSRTALKGSILMGVCLAAAYIVQTYGLVYTTPGKNAFLTATYCVITPFMAWAIYKRRPGGEKLLAAVLCMVGIGFVSLSSGFDNVNKGDLLTLCCGFFYALQIVLMEQYESSADALSISAVQFAASAVICLAGALLFEAPPHAVDAATWLSILYLSVMCTAVCFFLQAWGMKYTPSTPAAVIMTLESVFGVLTSVLFYHEPLTPRLLIGFALIFVSVLLSVTERKTLA